MGTSAFGASAGATSAYAASASAASACVASSYGCKPRTPLDHDEQFEQMSDALILQQDPDALPFFKASKLASARSTKGRRPADKPQRPFQ